MMTVSDLLYVGFLTGIFGGVVGGIIFSCVLQYLKK